MEYLSAREAGFLEAEDTDPVNELATGIERAAVRLTQRASKDVRVASDG